MSRYQQLESIKTSINSSTSSIGTVNTSIGTLDGKVVLSNTHLVDIKTQQTVPESILVRENTDIECMVLQGKGTVNTFWTSPLPGNVTSVGQVQGVQFNVNSDSALDTSAGDNARSVEVFGYDVNGDPASSTVDLNGTTMVASTGTLLYGIKYAKVKTWGTGVKFNMGNIYISVIGGGLNAGLPTSVYMVIPLRQNIAYGPSICGNPLKKLYPMNVTFTNTGTENLEIGLFVNTPVNTAASGFLVNTWTTDYYIMPIIMFWLEPGTSISQDISYCPPIDRPIATIAQHLSVLGRTTTTFCECGYMLTLVEK